MLSGAQALLPRSGAIPGNPGLEGVLPTAVLPCSFQHHTLPLGRDGMLLEPPCIPGAGGSSVSIPGTGLGFGEGVVSPLEPRRCLL